MLARKLLALSAASLMLAAPALSLACPGSGDSEPSPKHAARTTQQAPTMAHAAEGSDCAYSARSGSGCCSGMGFGGRLAATAAGAGLLAFSLGWAAGGKKKGRDEGDKGDKGEALSPHPRRSRPVSPS